MKTGAIFDSERAASRDAENISDEQDAASVYGISSVLHATCIVFRNVLRVLATETSVSRYLVDADSCSSLVHTPREPASEFKSEML